MNAPLDPDLLYLKINEVPKREFFAEIQGYLTVKIYFIQEKKENILYSRDKGKYILFKR